jgi:pimeloyl-ACP methyl ester carboxylesterase
MTSGRPVKISRRSVFLIGGYDPKTPAAFFGRLATELKRFEETWDVSASMSPVSVSSDGEIGTVEIEAAGADWRVATHFGFLVLDKIVLEDFSRPLYVRLFKYLSAFNDYALSGTYFRMIRRAWRFAFYFSYPHAMTTSFAIVSILAGYWVATLFPPLSILAGVATACALFTLLLSYLGYRWWITHLMDLWSFSLNFLRGRRPDAEALLDDFARAIVAHARDSPADELILVGHSTGGALVLDVAARCLAIDPQFTERSARTAVLTVGSTALKLGMHPAATTFRGHVQTLIDDPRLVWVDVQCLIDPINFYKSDPVAGMGLLPRIKDMPEGLPFPLTRVVRIKDMLEPATYKRIRWNLFRVHYQYIFGNTKRYFYDFFMICCGPVPLAERMRDEIVGAAVPGEETSS